MSDFKKLLDLAQDRASLARRNPGVDTDLLTRWSKLKADRPEPKKAAHQYDLQRAFDDGAQRMVGVLHGQSHDE